MSKLEWTPLCTRFLAHRLGDGTVNVHGRAVWDNNRPEHFLKLCELLKIDVWKPTKSGKCTKIIMPNCIFDEYANLYGYNSKLLRQDSEYLAKTFLERPEDRS